MTRAAQLATVAPLITTTAGAVTQFAFPSGSTADRPATPTTGATRYNTTTNSVEYYNGSSWVAF